MGHLPAPTLHKWASGDRLFADQLTHNFGALHGLVEAAAALAVEPDRNGAEALQRVTNAETRIAALERYNRSTPRERGEKQWAPLAAFGELVQQVSRLRDPMDQAIQHLRADVRRRRAAEQALGDRIAAVETRPAPPPAPSLAAFRMLSAELDAARAEAQALREQIAQLRTDLAAQREQAETSVSIASSLYRQLESRMATFEASTAAKDVVEMRGEVQRLQRTLDNTDRKEALQRFFTPRAAFAYLMRRVERLEKGAA